MREGIEAIVHCAALAYVHESEMIPDEYHSVNVIGTKVVSETADSTGVKSIIFSSSCSVYGEPRTVPVAENSDFNPLSNYAITKVKGESIISSSSQYSSMSLRFFNAAGGAPTAGIGEAHDPETHIIPKLLRFALGFDTEPVTLYAMDADGSVRYPERDFVHVLDIAEAHLLALEKISRLGCNRHNHVNIGSGRPSSLLDVISLVEQVSGTPIADRLVIGRRQSCDPLSVYADTSLSRELLGWEPQRSLQQIVSDAYLWLRHSENLI